MLQLSIAESIVLYIMIAVLSAVLMRVAQNEFKFNKIFIFLAFLVIALPSAFRYEVGMDYTGYALAYNAIIRAGSIYNSMWDIEYSFKVLSFISYYLIGSPQLLFVFYAVLTNLFIVLGIYAYRKETSMSIMMFMYTTIFYLATMNIARQMLAISIVFFASKYIRDKSDKSFIKYALFVLLAVIFHKSALLALVFYLFAIKVDAAKRFLQIMMYVLPIIIIFFMDQLLNLITSWSIFNEYATAYTGIGMTIGLGFVAQLIICLLIYIGYKNNHLKCSKNIQYFIVQFKIYAAIFSLTQYRIDNCGGRISLYFLIFDIVALSMLAKAGWGYDRNKSFRIYYKWVPYVYAILLFAMSLINDSQGCLPYSLWTGY